MSGRLEELAARHVIGPPGVAALDRYLDLLATDPSAPTTVRDRDRALEIHVADALSGLAVPALAGARLAADVGAGAGVPGLVLAAARPALRVVEVESSSRKCAFLGRAIASMGLTNATVACTRVEQWADGRDRCDAVVARAVAPLAVLVEYAAPIVRIGGVLVAWKGAPDAAEEADGRSAARVLGLEPSEPLRLAPTETARRRTLYVYLKVRSPPNGYPRRAGMARKRPLRASS